MHKDIYCSMCGEHADNCRTKEETLEKDAKFDEGEPE